MVAPPGLEPGRPKTHDFKSCASTNSAMGPTHIYMPRYAEQIDL